MLVTCGTGLNTQHRDIPSLGYSIYNGAHSTSLQCLQHRMLNYATRPEPGVQHIHPPVRRHWRCVVLAWSLSMVFQRPLPLRISSYDGVYICSACTVRCSWS